MTAELDFTAVYQEFQPQLHRYLVRLVGVEVADDVSQDVFIKVKQALPQFRGEAKLSTWLYRIATNAAIDSLRTRPVQSAPVALAEFNGTLKNIIYNTTKND